MISSNDRLFLWGTVAAVGGLNLAGYAFGLWSEIAWYDNALHALTTFAVTLVIGVQLAPILRLDRNHGLLFVVLVASAGLTLGVA